MGIVAENQNHSKRGKIKSSFIYVEKKQVDEFIEAVDKNLWLNIKAYTSTFDETFEIDIILRIAKCRRVDENIERVVFEVSGDLAVESYGKISSRFVKFIC